MLARIGCKSSSTLPSNPTSRSCRTLAWYDSFVRSFVADCLFRWHLSRSPYINYPNYALPGFVGFYHLAFGVLRAMATVKVISWPSFNNIIDSAVFRTLVISGGLIIVSAVVAFTDGLYFAPNKQKWPEFDAELPEWMRPSAS